MLLAIFLGGAAAGKLEVALEFYAQQWTWSDGGTLDAPAAWTFTRPERQGE